jgi:hypothetical protein
MRRVLLCIIQYLSCYCNALAYLNRGNYGWRDNNGIQQEATRKAGQDTAINISDYKAGKVFDKETFNVINNGV